MFPSCSISTTSRTTSDPPSKMMNLRPIPMGMVSTSWDSPFVLRAIRSESIHVIGTKMIWPQTVSVIDPGAVEGARHSNGTFVLFIMFRSIQKMRSCIVQDRVKKEVAGDGLAAASQFARLPVSDWGL
jgi:hypothetical protein